MILTAAEINAMSVPALAHMGDAVYDLLVRRELCRKGKLTAGDLHKETIRYVSAAAQSEAAGIVFPYLQPQEQNIYKRGRNAKTHAAPHSVTEGEYHRATGLEALFGWLFLREDNSRIEELFSMIWREQYVSRCPNIERPDL